MDQNHQPDPGPTRESIVSKIGGGSLAASLAIHGALLAVGVMWIFHVFPDRETKADVRFAPGGGGVPAADKNASRKQREAMSRPDLSRVAAVNSISGFTLPEPEMAPSLDKLGTLGGSSHPTQSSVIACFPNFPGQDGSMKGPGNGHAPVIFTFDPKQAAGRIAYVLDFSVTMAGEKDSLMRTELEKALKALPTTTRYSVICFSGPVWLPGDEVTRGTVKSRGKTYQWDSKSMWEWTHRGPLMDAPWHEAKPSEVKRTLSLVDEVKTIGGTDWQAPLEMAIAMNPPPDIVFFMTDGVMEQRDMMRLTRSIAAKAKARNVTINTVSLMEPGAEEPMADLAKRTGGSFTIVGKDGKILKGAR